MKPRAEELFKLVLEKSKTPSSSDYQLYIIGASLSFTLNMSKFKDITKKRYIDIKNEIDKL